MIELKPCPFCGGDAALVVLQSVGIGVRCTNSDCKCQTNLMYDDVSILGSWPEKIAIEEVIKRWNRRA